MPQATAPTPQPQKPTRSNSVRMDFAPRKGGVPQRPVAKSVAKPAAPSRPASVTKPAAKPAPKSVAKPVSRPAPHPAPKSTPQPTTPERRPALIASAREAMNAHIYAQQAQQPQSSPSSPEQGTTAPTAPQATAPQAATRLHRTTVQTATRQRVTPMPTLPPPPTRPVAPLRAGTDPLVQRARPLPKSTPAPSAPKQQIKVSASAASTASTNPNSDSAATTEDTSANNTRYALGERSPFFLQSVSVEKRPLSSGRPASRSTARKNVYPKKPAVPKPEKPSLPTIVVPDSHRSKAPLIALILFTILLGALVGAAAYFFFFQ